VKLVVEFAKISFTCDVFPNPVVGPHSNQNRDCRPFAFTVPLSTAPVEAMLINGRVVTLGSVAAETRS